PAIAPTRQCAGEFLLQQRLNEAANASPNPVLDRVEPILKKQPSAAHSRPCRGIFGHGVVSIPARQRRNRLGYATRRLRQPNSNHLRDGTWKSRSRPQRLARAQRGGSQQGGIRDKGCGRGSRLDRERTGTVAPV